MKLDPATGTEVWRRIIDGRAHWTDHGSTVAVDSHDDVVAVGEIQRPVTKTEFTAVLLNGGTGRVIRQVLLDGTDHWFDRGLRRGGEPIGGRGRRGMVHQPGDGRRSRNRQIAIELA
jgi:hypothetical protein